MNRALFKLVCSAVAVVAMGTQAFAQAPKQDKDKCPAAAFQQGDDGLMMNQFPAAYNTPGSIATKGGWDVFFDASFIYWHADQDNMDLAYGGAQNASSAAEATAPVSSQVLFQDVSYKPGFKVGFGFNTDYDGWVGNVEYTWLHQTTTTSANAPATATASGTGAGVWVPNDWFAATGAVIQASQINSSWKLQMDMIDASMSRPFYQGRQLTILPYAGLRSLFLRQALRINATNVFNTAMPAYSSENISQSWSIGPNAGMNAHWIVGSGFRFEGFAGASILYTRYTKIAHDEHNQVAAGSATSPFVGRVTQLGTLRPVMDAGLGLGWGTYFSNQAYHFDLLARYDFMVAWSQNVMRQLTNLYTPDSVGAPAGDLHLHGLTLSARFDF